jgi:Ca2+-binding EF-hand superfamily protein
MFSINIRRVSPWLCGLAVATCLAGFSRICEAADGGEPTPEDSLFLQLDQNADGEIDPAEVPSEQQTLFSHLLEKGDKDGDGKLSAVELRGATGDLEPAGKVLGDISKGSGGQKAGMMVLERLDKNKDGQISRDEIPEQLKGRLNPLFDKMKVETISLQQLSKLMDRAENGPDPKQLFAQFDKNKDGSLSKDELPERAQQRFGQIFERLGKETITREEFETAIKARMAMGGKPKQPEGKTPKVIPGESSGTEAKKPGQKPQEGKPKGKGKGGMDFFKEADTNQDNMLAEDEVPERLKGRFKEIDQDADGLLSRDEVQAFMRERMKK